MKFNEGFVYKMYRVDSATLVLVERFEVRNVSLSRQIKEDCGIAIFSIFAYQQSGNVQNKGVFHPYSDRYVHRRRYATNRST